jgi:hypothetical protein
MSLFVEPEGATQLNADDVAGLKFDHICIFPCMAITQ